MFTTLNSMRDSYVSFINRFIPTKDGKYISWQDIVNIKNLTERYVGDERSDGMSYSIDYDSNTGILYYSNHPIYNIDGSIKTIDSKNIDLNKYERMKEAISPYDVYKYDLLMKNHEESCNIIEELLKQHSIVMKNIEVCK